VLKRIVLMSVFTFLSLTAAAAETVSRPQALASRLDQTMAMNQLDSVYSLVKEGLGVAYLPLFFDEASRGSTVLERILPDWEVMQDPESSSSVHALLPGGPHVSAKVRVFVDHLVDRLSHLL